MSAKTGGIASGATFRRWRASTFLQVGETLHENFSGVTWGFVSACPPVRPHGMSAAFRQDSLVDLGHAVDPAPGAAIFMRPPADTFVPPLICKRCRVSAHPVRSTAGNTCETSHWDVSAANRAFPEGCQWVFPLDVSEVPSEPDPECAPTWALRASGVWFLVRGSNASGDRLPLPPGV